jgi:hypothetical protein
VRSPIGGDGGGAAAMRLALGRAGEVIRSPAASRGLWFGGLVASGEWNGELAKVGRYNWAGSVWA